MRYPTSWKIQQLLRAGANRHDIKEGVRLRMECSWSTAVTEQQHASVKLIHRRHPDYLTETILIRAGLHTLRLLLPTVTREQALVEKLQKKLTKLTDTRSSTVTARLMYLKDVTEAMQRKYAAQHQHIPVSRYQDIMKVHGRRWLQLSEAAKHEWETKAVIFQQEKARAKEETVSELIAQIGVARLRSNQVESLAANSPLKLGTCTFTPEDVAQWQLFYDALGEHPRDLATLRQRAMETPARPDAEEVAELERRPYMNPRQEVPRPPWVQVVAAIRTELKPCALRTHTNPGGSMAMLRCCK